MSDSTSPSQLSGFMTGKIIHLPSGFKICVEEVRSTAAKELFSNSKWDEYEHILRCKFNYSANPVDFKMLKQYLSLKAAYADRINDVWCPPLFAPPTRNVDKAWHEMILCSTKDYAVWTTKILGSVVHHMQTCDRNWQRRATQNAKLVIHAIFKPEELDTSASSKTPSTDAPMKKRGNDSVGDQFSDSKEPLLDEPMPKRAQVSMCG